MGVQTCALPISGALAPAGFLVCRLLGGGTSVADPPRNGEGDHAKHGGGAKSACLADEITRYDSVAGNAAHSVQRGVSRLCPSTTPRVVPLPLRGRIAMAATRPPPTPPSSPPGLPISPALRAQQTRKNT